MSNSRCPICKTSYNSVVRSHNPFMTQLNYCDHWACEQCFIDFVNNKVSVQS